MFLLLMLQIASAAIPKVNYIEIEGQMDIPRVVDKNNQQSLSVRCSFQTSDAVATESKVTENGNFTVSLESQKNGTPFVCFLMKDGLMFAPIVFETHEKIASVATANFFPKIGKNLIQLGKIGLKSGEGVISVPQSQVAEKTRF